MESSFPVSASSLLLDGSRVVQKSDFLTSNPFVLKKIIHLTIPTKSVRVNLESQLAEIVQKHHGMGIVDLKIRVVDVNQSALDVITWENSSGIVITIFGLSVGSGLYFDPSVKVTGGEKSVFLVYGASIAALGGGLIGLSLWSRNALTIDYALEISGSVVTWK